MDKDWIEKRLSQVKKTKAQLARALDIPPPRVTELIKGQRRIQIDEVIRLSRFLNLPAGVVLERATGMYGDDQVLPHDMMDPIYIHGFVQAGIWAEQAELPFDDREIIYAPVNKAKFPNVFGLKVLGDSMNEVFPQNTILMVTPMYEYFGAFETGLYVICQRSRAGTYETTVKQLEIRDDRYWLWPRSTNPDFQQPIPINPPKDWTTTHHGIQDDGVAVVGVVVGSYRPEI